MMKRRVGAVIVALVPTVACWNPLSPSAKLPDQSFSWTVNGESFGADANGMGALSATGAVTLTGFDCSRGVGVTISLPGSTVQPGTYEVGDRTYGSYHTNASSPGNSLTWTAGTFSGGSGSVTITRASGSGVSGTFAFEMIPDPGNPSSGTRLVQGSFDLVFHEKTIC